jgi:hypothetical protein
MCQCDLLRIPGGWFVRQNELRSIEPVRLGEADPHWGLLMEDLLQLKHPSTDLTLDVGWYPDGSPNGEFILMVIIEGDWQRPLLRFATRELGVLV